MRIKNIICPRKTDFCARDFKFKDRSFPIMMENTNTNTNDKSSFAKEADQICSNNDSSASNDTRRNASKKTGGGANKTNYQSTDQLWNMFVTSNYLYIFNEWKKRKSFESSQGWKCHRGPSSPDKKSYLVPIPHSLTTSFDLLLQWREIAINCKGINNWQ